jgi:hypothetical protein
MADQRLQGSERRENFEQLVTDILFALSECGDGDRLILRDGPDVDDAREAVMRELLAYDGVGAVGPLREAERLLHTGIEGNMSFALERVREALGRLAA